MPNLVFGGWPTGIALSQVLRETRLLTQNASLDHLSTDPEQQAEIYASLIGTAVDEVLDAMGGIGNVESDPLALGLGSDSLAIPDDIRGRDVVQFRITDTAGLIWPVSIVGRQAFDLLQKTDPVIQTVGFSGRPQSAAFSEDGQSFQLFPTSDGDYTAKITYRQERSIIEGDDLADEGTDFIIGELPKRLARALCLLIASRVVEPINATLSAQLEKKFSNPRPAPGERQGELEKVLMGLRRVPARLRQPQDGPRGLINNEAFFKGLQPITYRRVGPS